MRVSIPALALALAACAAPAASFAAANEGMTCPIPKADTARIDNAPMGQCEARGYATCSVQPTVAPASYAQPSYFGDDPASQPRRLTRSEIRAELDAVKVSRPAASQRLAELSDQRD